MRKFSKAAMRNHARNMRAASRVNPEVLYASRTPRRRWYLNASNLVDTRSRQGGDDDGYRSKRSARVSTMASGTCAAAAGPRVDRLSSSSSKGSGSRSRSSPRRPSSSSKGSSSSSSRWLPRTPSSRREALEALVVAEALALAAAVESTSSCCWPWKMLLMRRPTLCRRLTSRSTEVVRTDLASTRAPARPRPGGVASPAAATSSSSRVAFDAPRW
mmetsp:Transcript_36427/g.116758  ORF Transcript_36427/g.116758 Transcript_36427/m.116758 type:complete len:216 (+) Transcript_36427:683-1330(+)